jgi:hypothetical protein
MQKSNYQDDTSTTTLKAVEQKFKSGEVVLVVKFNQYVILRLVNNVKYLLKTNRFWKLIK